jgi:pimeloyl-ACP methyl ester carboxylesterase
MAYAQLNGVRLFFTDDGAGPFTLLLMRGLTANSHDWSWVIPSLAPRYRLIACDFRGHGSSRVTPTRRSRC